MTNRRSALLGALVVAAGIVHLAVAPGHFTEGALVGLFFFAVGASQVAAGAYLLRRPSSAVGTAVALGSVVLIALWAVSRTVGLPIGAEAGLPEPVALPDAVATGLELLAVALVVAPSFGRQPGRWTGSAAVAAGTAGAFAVAVVVAAGALAGVSEAMPAGHAHGAVSTGSGHGPLELVMVSVALLAVVGYTAAEVAAGRRPSFSLRLRSETSSPR